MKTRLIVVDVSNFIFRAFFAIRMLNSPDGTPVNAVQGVLSMLLKLMADYRPTHILLARDTAGGTFRNEMYEAYKANRSEPPEELVPQFALIDELIKKMQLPQASDQNFEADDIIGSAVIQWRDKFDEILIASGDKDLMQFVGGPVKMLDTMKDKIYGPDDVFEKMGVRPDQIVDYLSMVGDSSDNIPGMKGIGAKGAAKLLEEYGTLEKCIENKEKMSGKKLINAFENHLDDALLSKKLVQIVTNLDLGLSAEKAEFKFYPSDELLEFLSSLGFKSAIKKLQDMRYQDHIAENNDESSSFVDLVEKKAEAFKFELIDSDELVAGLVEKLKASSACSLDSLYDSEDIISRELKAMAISFNGNEASLVDFSKLSEKSFEEILKWTWGNEHLEICSEHIKKDYSYCVVHQRDFKALTFDVVQAHYNTSSLTRHDLASMSDEVLGRKLELTPSKKEQTLLDFEQTQNLDFIGERSCLILQIAELLKGKLKEQGVEDIYYLMDDKLNPVLAKMEVWGISLDRAFLKDLEEELAVKLENIEKSIADIVGDKINLNSPKQVGELLFEKLNLPVLKKTKTGASTDVEVLEELAAMNVSEVPELILQYRELGKLQSTYVKALPALVNPKTKRIHTSFNTHVAQTGRLSSTNPNLQNIPVRSETGKKVRKAFVAKEGHYLLAADYSQVELRLLAHFSEDPTMLEAFKKGQDIHAQTASEVMGVELKDVTPNERSKAKAVNFGLMYGQSSFGLSKALKISRGEAKDYITTYFERFSRVKSFLDSLKEKCEQTGYAQTYHGRKRWLPDIQSQNRTVKAMAERMAINSPIQGTAADILKLAMIKIDEKLKSENFKAKMLLQVHDELIFEVPEDEVERLEKLVRQEMEHVVELKVPLNVDVGVAKNWFDIK